MKPAENFGINPKRFKIVKEDLFSSGRGTHIGLQSLTDPFESIFTAMSTNGIDSDQDFSDYLLQPKVHFICVKKRTKLTLITYSIDEDDHARCEAETIYALSEHEIFRMPSRFVTYALNVLREVGIYVVILSTDARVPQLLQDESMVASIASSLAGMRCPSLKSTLLHARTTFYRLYRIRSII